MPRTLIALLCLAAALSGCTSPGSPEPKRADSYRAVERIPLDCGEGGEARLSRWGNSGYRKWCWRDGLPHGPVAHWEEGYLNLTGSYFEGEKDGDWTVYHGDGTVYVVITFERGVKKGRRVVTPLDLRNGSLSEGEAGR